MKRLTLLLVAVALLWPAAANAQLTMQMSNGWSFTFAGNVNVFWVFTKENTAAGDAANSSVRTGLLPDRKSTRLNSSHLVISYAVFCLKKKNIKHNQSRCARSVLQSR